MTLSWYSRISVIVILVSISVVFIQRGLATPQHISQSHGRESLPLPLTHPGQPGYIIIPKSNFNRHSNAPPPPIGQMQRRPPNIPPQPGLPNDKPPPPQNNRPPQRQPSQQVPKAEPQPAASNDKPYQRQPISSHILPQNDQVRLHTNNRPPQIGVSNVPNQQDTSSQNQDGQRQTIKQNRNGTPPNLRNNRPPPPNYQKRNRLPPNDIIFGPTIKLNKHQQNNPPLIRNPIHFPDNRPIPNQILEAQHFLQQGLPLPPEINFGPFFQDNPAIHIDSNGFLHDADSIREILKLKSPIKKKKLPQHPPLLFPNHPLPGGEEPLAGNPLPSDLILPQSEPVLPIDIAHGLGDPGFSHSDENVILDHPHEGIFNPQIETQNKHSQPPVESKAPIVNEPQPQPPPPDNYASAQALQSPIENPPPPQDRKPHEAFHIPFPDFAEPEPSFQLKPTHPNHAPVYEGSNRILPPQDPPKPVDISPKSKHDQDFHIPEESAPVSLYGEVLPPNDISYNSEINNFPGIHDIPNNEAWPLPMPEMPKIINLDVKCAKNLMRISIDFDKPFHGIIYSKGHYSYGRCVHLPSGSGHLSVDFDISINSCGMHGNSATGNYGPTETGSYFENTIIVQYDPLVQEVWDQARKLRCNWHDQYEKTVTFRPFNVDMLHVVRADFAGDNVGCWMQIQVGKGPWASEVSGIVRIGQTMTLVLAIKDEENKFDMLVRNCIAHDGNRAPIELVDSAGCIMRPKLMSRFTKVKNFGSSASVLSFAHFQAFKFPDSTDVHIQCTVQICRGQCVDQCSALRRKRDTFEESREVGLNSLLQVVAVEDLSFSLTNGTDPTQVIEEDDEAVCMSKSGFAASLILLLSVVIIACLLASFLCLRQRVEVEVPPSPYDLAVFKKNAEKEAKKQLKELSRKL